MSELPQIFLVALIAACIMLQGAKTCPPLAEDVERFIAVFRRTLPDLVTNTLQEQVSTLLQNASKKMDDEEASRARWLVQDTYAFGNDFRGLAFDIPKAGLQKMRKRKFGTKGLAKDKNMDALILPDGLAFLAPVAKYLDWIERSPRISLVDTLLEESNLPSSLSNVINKHNATSAKEDPNPKAQRAFVQRPADWNLCRISTRANNANVGYRYDSDGSGTDIYVVDTGIYSQHPEFEGRALTYVDFTGEGWTDTGGHGTHVAGIIGSRTYGVAKKAKLLGVRIIGARGTSDWATVISALNWIYNRISAVGTARKPIINMSVGGPFSQALNQAVSVLVSRHSAAVVVASGNSGRDACSFSPASCVDAFAVAASSRTDTWAAFSNYGSCVDFVAPGEVVRSTYLNNGTALMSGTSMAAPHMTGILALLWTSYPYLTLTQLRQYLSASATSNVLRSVPTNTPNRLAYALVYNN